MKTVIIPAILATTVLIAGMFAFMPVEKATTVHTTIQDTVSDVGFREADHGLVDVTAGESGVCGSDGEPWILYVSATSPSVAGTVTLKFKDGDTIIYNVLSGSSFSAQFAFGGVPDVDDIVGISGGGGVTRMVVSALAPGGAVDPFIEDPAESDNFCVVDPSELDVSEAPNNLPFP